MIKRSFYLSNYIKAKCMYELFLKGTYISESFMEHNDFEEDLEYDKEIFENVFKVVLGTPVSYIPNIFLDSIKDLGEVTIASIILENYEPITIKKILDDSEMICIIAFYSKKYINNLNVSFEEDTQNQSFILKFPIKKYNEYKKHVNKLKK